MRPLLEVEGLSVAYRRRGAVVRALDDVSFDVGAGETVGLVGESGSGKSTAGRAILGLTPVSAGTIRFDGRDVTELPFAARRELYRDMQMVFQDPYSSLNPSRTIGQTLAEPLRAFGLRDRAQLRARVREMLERVDLPPEAQARHPREFSGGQRQRIAIARALMLEPRLVICDEAVSALDLSIQAQVLNLLRELQGDSGLSYLFISHDLEVVRHLCDRIVVLYRGQVMESGEGARVSSDPAHPYTFALQQAAPVPDPRLQRSRRRARAAQAATSLDTAAESGGCPFAPRCPHAQARCRSERPRPRVVHDGGVVACHRYPEWRDELAGAGVFAAPGGDAAGVARLGPMGRGTDHDA
ncbi:MAG TPA: ABC transporter ATP-binding protein [Conexibacter sp.]|nr:ABC transporter ATP-binding protein [Conexibacter sp.]